MLSYASPDHPHNPGMLSIAALARGAAALD